MVRLRQKRAVKALVAANSAAGEVRQSHTKSQMANESVERCRRGKSTKKEKWQESQSDLCDRPGRSGLCGEVCKQSREEGRQKSRGVEKVQNQAEVRCREVRSVEKSKSESKS